MEVNRHYYKGCGTRFLHLVMFFLCISLYVRFYEESIAESDYLQYQISVPDIDKMVFPG
jgi:hypothetical protein